MNVLVTGCAGYIGTQVCQSLLQAGYRVLGVDSLLYRNGSALLGLLGHHDFSFHQVDVRHHEQVRKLASTVDVVIPLAAIVGAPACEKEPGEAEEVNFRAVKALVGSLSSSQRVVFTNTNSGYGTQRDGQEVTEDSPLMPISHYGRTKCRAEVVVLSHPRGVSLRLATVFGASPRMRFDLLVNDFVRQLVLHGKLTIFEPHFTRNYIHVRDVSRAIWFAISQGLTGAFNVGNPWANMTKLELAYRVCDVLGMDRSLVSVGEGRDPDQRNYLVSNAKLLRRGFTFQHYLDWGVREVAQVVLHVPEGQTIHMRNS